MKKKGILIALVTFVLTLVMSVCVSTVRAQEQQPQSPFEATYALGDTLKIPSRSITYDGVTKEASAVITYPDTSKVSQDSVKLTEAGKYTVEYRATINGRVRKETYSFVVDYPMYELTAKSDFASYQSVTVNGATDEGLLVKINNGSTFKCNQVIDLNEMQPGQNLLSFFVVPEAFGSHDCNYIYIKIADALDLDNYILIRIRQSPEQDSALYVGARACNQEAYWGVEKGHPDGTPLSEGNWGFALEGSFKGYGFGSHNREIRLSYDNDTQTVYMDNNYYSNGGNYVIDFNNPLAFTEGWDGFDSGKVVISMDAGDYIKGNMSFLVTSLAQVDLRRTALDLKEPSGLEIDYGDYDSTSYPHAVKGKPYRIFDATPYSTYTPERVTVSVKTSYGASSAKNVDVKKGADGSLSFTPLSNIRHTIVYTVTDGFGQTKDYTVPVEVDATYTPVTFSVSATAITARIGERIAMPEFLDMAGGNGVLKTKMVLKNKTTGETVEIKDDTCRIMTQGNYEFVYTVSDYNTCSKSITIPITLTPVDGPEFGEDPILPLTYIKGAKYSVPALYADDFSSGSQQIIQATSQVYSGTKELTVTNGYFVAEGTSITLKYTAKDGLNRTRVQEYTVSVTDVGFTSTLDLTKYFIAEGGVATTVNRTIEGSTQKLIALQAQASNARFKFIRELNGRSFTTTFALEDKKTNYEKIVLRLIDAIDENKYVEVVLTNKDDKIAVTPTGGMEIKTKFKFGGDVKDCVAQLDGNTLFICNEYFTIRKYVDGTDFTGFDKFVRFEMDFVNCTDTAEIIIKNINQQSMNNGLGEDGSEPNLMYIGKKCPSEADLNEIVSLNPVFVADVLDPYATITLSVKTPSGEYATALDGTVLKSVPTDKTYQLKLAEYGSYSISYKYADSNGNGRTRPMTVNCLDKKAPVISVGTDHVSGRVGEKITVPEYTATDNYSTGSAVKGYIQIITPDGLYLSYNAKTGYTPTKAGVYTIRYLVFDGNYNLQYKDIICIVV